MFDEELTMRAILGMPPPNQFDTQQNDSVEDMIIPVMEIDEIEFIPEEIAAVETVEEMTLDDPELLAHEAPVIEDAEIIISTVQDTEQSSACGTKNQSRAEFPSLTDAQYYFILGMREVIKLLKEREEYLEGQVNIPEKTIFEKLEAEIAERKIAECIEETEKYMHKCIRSTENRQTIHQ